LVGKDFYAHCVEHPNIKFFNSFEHLKFYLSDKNITNQNILIKGSRGMALERVMDLL